jgi:eukaryotic-like serine/threonine-protein kinase
MTPERWNQLFDLFHLARERSGADRVSVLEQACGEDATLLRAVEELLREDQAASGFLSEPVFYSVPQPVRPSQVVAGQHIGRYFIKTLIGRGGMGAVWSAQDTDLDRMVAIKFLSSETLGGLDPQQITREAKAASALNHPGIVTIYEVIPFEDSSAMVMELVEGASLREACANPLPITDVLTIGYHIAEALGAAHTHGVVHGDIKPENIFLRPDQYVKLLDFGLARRITTETIALGISSGLGTLRYMSPEQARSEPLTPASDIFSFGLVLYELFTGRHAFPAISALETAQGILEKEPVPLLSQNPHVSPRLAALVHAMLAKNPALRPTAQQIAHSLDQESQRKSASSPSFRILFRWGAAAALLIAIVFTRWQWKRRPVQETVPAVIQLNTRQLTTLVPDERATAASIAPNGMLAAYANADGIFLRTIQDGDTRPLPGPPDFVADRLTWFADSATLVASGYSPSTTIPSVWIVSTTGQPPRRLQEGFREGIPSPDGTEIAMIRRDGSAVSIVSSSGGVPSEVVHGPPGDLFPIIFWLPGNKRLGFQRLHVVPGRQRRTQGPELFGDRSFESIDLDTNKVTVRVADVQMSSAAALPDGRILYVRYLPPSQQPADQFDQLWEMKTDPATGAVTTAPHKVANLVEEFETHISSLSASVDGNHMLVIKRNDHKAIFLGDFDESIPSISNIRRLTVGERTSYAHAWTADGSGVIFESFRNGTWDLFIQNLNQRNPRTLVATPLSEVLPQLTPDGRWVLYAASPAANLVDYRLMRIPADGGTPAQVPIEGKLDEFRCGLSPAGRCVLRATKNHDDYVFSGLDPITGQGPELARTTWFPTAIGVWDLSPDGKQVAIPVRSLEEARIRVLTLATGSNPAGQRDVGMPGVVDLSGVTWSATGRGWFVGVTLPAGNRLFYVYPSGKFRSLGDIPGFVVPSRDGRHLAFVNFTVATNAWLLERP